MNTGGWEAELSAAAEADLRQIVQWTKSRFGDEQARRYAKILKDLLNALKHGPNAPGARARGEFGRGYMSVHAGRRGRRARHIVLFRIVDRGDGARVYVVRVLHEAMDTSVTCRSRTPASSAAIRPMPLPRRCRASRGR